MENRELTYISNSIAEAQRVMAAMLADVRLLATVRKVADAC
ncbi:phosphoheptose isomerase, partial [Burkholderia pseudomallei]